MLTIGKPAQFGHRGTAIIGQTLPESPNWRLRWFSRGSETLLHTGAYALCRRMQDACRGLGDLEAIKTVVDNLARQPASPARLFPVAGGKPTEIYPPVSDAIRDEPNLDGIASAAATTAAAASGADAWTTDAAPKPVETPRRRKRRRR